MEKTHNKIIAISLIALAVFLGYAVSTLLTILAGVSGTVAKLTANPVVFNVVPIAVGAIFFFVAILNKNVRSYADDVVAEVSKVVWPSLNDTRSLAIVVCIIILILSLILSVFDILSREVVEFIINFNY